MTMDSIQREFSVSKSQALNEIYNRILRFTPCCPPENRGDRHMLILLCDTLKNEPWAEDTCSLRLSNGDITFPNMYGKFAAILTDKLRKRSVVYSIHTSSTTMASPVSFGQRFSQTPDSPGAICAVTARPHRALTPHLAVRAEVLSLRTPASDENGKATGRLTVIPKDNLR
jgi:hypothetical protein